eukprot:Em0003g1228a
MRATAKEFGIDEKQLSDYKVLLKKENAWKAISTAVKASVEDCQKRWKALREKFGRETKRKKKRTGEAADFTPDWELLPHMMFLKDFVKHRCTTGNMEPSSIPSDDEADNGVNCSSQRNDESGAVQEFVPNPPPPAAISEGHNSQPVSPSVISSSPVSTASLQSLAWLELQLHICQTFIKELSELFVEFLNMSCTT